jgi:hypothetical protein
MDRELIASELVKVARDLVARDGYVMSMTYEVWDEEALEIGDTDERGWEVTGEKFDDLEELLRDSDVRDKSWIEWSTSGRPGRNSWINSDAEEDYRSGERTYYNLFIKRADGKPLSRDEVKHINKELGLR